MFDQIGGVGKLVKGKTVAIKFNLTGMPYQRSQTSHWARRISRTLPWSAPP